MELTIPDSHYISVFHAVMELKQRGLNPDMRTLSPHLSESRGLELDRAEIASYLANFITRDFGVLDASAYIHHYTFG
jgi:hypothetical protein